MSRRGLLAAAAIIASIACSALGASPTPSTSEASPSDVAGASPSAEPTAPPTPRTTPPGTPAPVPSEITIDSAAIETPPPAAQAAPTAPPDPGLWRIDGYVVDERGAPLSAVCVVIGPHGCRQFSPHTDERGYWFLDIAEGSSTFDFYFEMPGYNTVWWHTTPAGPTEFNVVLVKS